jgi:DNA-binding response OmpR family regulator
MIHTILVVDDDELMRANLIDVLTISNYEVYSAQNGKEALNVLDRQAVDLIITDIVMPDMEGIEFIKEVKQRRKLSVKIIAMSGSLMSDNYFKLARLLGADLTLKKPFKLDDILDAVRKLS